MLDTQYTFLAVAFAGATVAVNVSDAPVFKASVDALKATLLTAVNFFTTLTLTVAFALPPADCIVILAFPGFLPLMVPFLSTVAIFFLLVLKVIFFAFLSTLLGVTP